MHGSFGTMEQLVHWSKWSSGPYAQVDHLVKCTKWSTVPNGPMHHVFHLCTKCSNAPSGPMYQMVQCTMWSIIAFILYIYFSRLVLGKHYCLLYCTSSTYYCFYITDCYWKDVLLYCTELNADLACDYCTDFTVTVLERH